MQAMQMVINVGGLIAILSSSFALKLRLSQDIDGIFIV